MRYFINFFEYIPKFYAIISVKSEVIIYYAKRKKKDRSGVHSRTTGRD